ncbi:FxDxF family PEP-CTERM protein [Pseudoduganella sp. SL102]|uniref:FxDxF family PEP-CTERM protein n=1 Tax=Pseudoduganella sp. SL102 TaxID=2995154 RepID=UPI00248C0798|nr:FxDxF family PEP-CTERM protein [Pseudoduganella sp. SL102]WBR99968.1 FxDxF family PEP-CTERM protein [Pseudoduganella sp. SL102]
MPASVLTRWAGATAFAALAASPAFADTESVHYGNLTANAVVATPLSPGDNLFVDTFTSEHGALSQITTFTLESAADFNGLAGWIIDTADGQGPRLVGVNIDILDSQSTVVASDEFTGVLGGFAHSSFLGSLGPGIYTLVATGNAVRDASLDISLSFTPAVPEPATYGMLIGGFGVLAMLARRRR